MTCGYGDDIDFVFVDFQIICGIYELKSEIGLFQYFATAHYSQFLNVLTQKLNKIIFHSKQIK